MITPGDSPSSPQNYSQVAVSGTDIQAPQMRDEIQAAFDAANSVAGAGVLYGQGPRQAATERLLNSAQGYPDFDITAGFAGSGDDTWPNDVTPGG